jgi:two-component system, NtrC family, response regulator AtoC
MSATVLVVDDEDLARGVVCETLIDAGYEAIEAGNLAQAHEAVDSGTADIILLDIRLPDGSGLTLLDRLALENPRPPVILMTAFGEVELAVDAMKKGALDFLEKPLDLARLLTAVERASEEVALRRELALLRRSTGSQSDMIVGETPEMIRIMEEAERAAVAQVSVLITGPTGTGKEVLAQAIRTMSPRADKPFVAINCAALSLNVIESELFGYEPGAFTGATKRKLGLIEVADGGILFLDEISETETGTQAKLLRVLEERTFRRVGGVPEISVDIQIIAASNRELKAAIEEGKFREDLFYRLKVLNLHLPTLQERKADIPALVGSFISEINLRTGNGVNGITPRAIDALKNQPWPGNIRELRHAIERAMLFCDDELIDLGHLPPEYREI